jgi:hypothetical protein
MAASSFTDAAFSIWLHFTIFAYLAQAPGEATRARSADVVRRLRSIFACPLRTGRRGQADSFIGRDVKRVVSLRCVAAAHSRSRSKTI